MNRHLTLKHLIFLLLKDITMDMTEALRFLCFNNNNYYYYYYLLYYYCCIVHGAVKYFTY